MSRTVLELGITRRQAPDGFWEYQWGLEWVRWELFESRLTALGHEPGELWEEAPVEDVPQEVRDMLEGEITKLHPGKEIKWGLGDEKLD